MIERELAAKLEKKPFFCALLIPIAAEEKESFRD